MCPEPRSWPAYLGLRPGELRRRAEAAIARLERCDSCPRLCAVDRLRGERKVCATGRRARISSVGPHFGEESPLVGQRGSGTVFFAGCNLTCVFCQNADISRGSAGASREVDAAELAEAMLVVQQLGCHNLNLVTPTHVTAQILEALCVAVEGGFELPLVYNCGGYESLETLALLDGVVDIFMPDFKYAEAEPGRRYSGVPDYPEVARAALREMFRQVGDLELDGLGVARRGLLIRHLVLPEDQAGTARAMRFIAEELSLGTYVYVMDQYHPCGPVARGHPVIGRSLGPGEYRAAIEAALDAGLTRLDDRRRRR